MMLSNVIVDVTIPRCSFVFGQSRAKVSAGFTNVRSLELFVGKYSTKFPVESANCKVLKRINKSWRMQLIS